MTLRRALQWSASAAIVLFWAVMMWQLLANEILPRRMLGSEDFVTAEQFLEDWTDIDECHEIFYNDRSMGVFRVQIVRDSPYAFQAACRVRASFPLGPLTAHLKADALADLDHRLTLQDAALDCSVFMQRIRVEASVIQEAFHYAVFQNDELTDSGRVLLPNPPSLFQMTQSIMAREELEVGKMYMAPVFDPIWRFGGGVAVVKVLEKTTLQTRYQDAPAEVYVLETTFNQMKSTAWVDGSGRTLRQAFGRNLQLEWIPREVALARHPDLDPPLGSPDIRRDLLMALRDRPGQSSRSGALGMMMDVLGDDR